MKILDTIKIIFRGETRFVPDIEAYVVKEITLPNMSKQFLEGISFIRVKAYNMRTTRWFVIGQFWVFAVVSIVKGEFSFIALLTSLSFVMYYFVNTFFKLQKSFTLDLQNGNVVNLKNIINKTPSNQNPYSPFYNMRGITENDHFMVIEKDKEEKIGIGLKRSDYTFLLLEEGMNVNFTVYEMPCF